MRRLALSTRHRAESEAYRAIGNTLYRDADVWRSFGKLPPSNRSTREKLAISKRIIDARLRRIKSQVSARYVRIIYAAEIAANLRVIFYIEGNLVLTVDIS